MSDCLRYSPQAQLDLDEIYDFFTIEREDPETASRVITAILAAVQDVPNHPTRFPLVGPLPLTRDQYRFVHVGSYLVFYRVDDEIVYIDRILNQRRDFASLLGIES